MFELLQGDCVAARGGISRVGLVGNIPSLLCVCVCRLDHWGPATHNMSTEHDLCSMLVSVSLPPASGLVQLW